MHYREYIRFTKFRLAFFLSIFLLDPVLSPYIKGLGFSDLQMGILFSIMPLSAIIFLPLLGTLSDNIGRKSVILIGIGSEIAAIVLYSSTASFWIMAFAKVLEAVGVTSATLITLVKIEDSLDSRSRGKYAGISMSLCHAGKITAPVIGAIAADIYFVKAPFYIAIAVLSMLFIYLLTFEEKTKRMRYSFSMVKEIREFLSFRELRGMAVIGTAMHMSHPAMNLFLPLLIIEKFNMSFTYIGIAYFILGFTHLLQFYFGSLSDRYGRVSPIVLGCAIYGLFTCMVFFASSYSSLLVILFLVGIGGGMWNICAWSLMSDIGEGIRKEARIATSYMSIVKAGTFVSFVASGFVATFFGTEAVFLFSGIIILAGTALSLVFFRT